MHPDIPIERNVTPMRIRNMSAIWINAIAPNASPVYRTQRCQPGMGAICLRNTSRLLPLPCPIASSVANPRTVAGPSSPAPAPVPRLNVCSHPGQCRPHTSAPPLQVYPPPPHRDHRAAAPNSLSAACPRPHSLRPAGSPTALTDSGNSAHTPLQTPTQTPTINAN